MWWFEKVEVMSSTAGRISIQSSSRQNARVQGASSYSTATVEVEKTKVEKDRMRERMLDGSPAERCKEAIPNCLVFRALVTAGRRV